jgi:2-deoxy-D-gluconate 3-dehydrogenase
MALALSKAGADLILVQRDTSNTTTKTRIETEGGLSGKGGKSEIVVCDLGDAASVAKLIPGVVASGKVLDIVVNCGGIQRRHPVEIFPDDDWNDVLQVNLNAVFAITRDAGKHMLESRGGVAGQPGKEYKTNGKIINVSSLIAYQGGLNVVAYAAAKHGVQGIVSRMMTVRLHVECGVWEMRGKEIVLCSCSCSCFLSLHPFSSLSPPPPSPPAITNTQVKSFSNGWAAKGVNVNAIAPGYIVTDMNEAVIADETRSRQILERIPAGRWGTPKDFAGAIVYLASPASDYVSGECIVVDGGWMGR